MQYNTCTHHDFQKNTLFILRNIARDETKRKTNYMHQHLHNLLS